MGDIVADAEKVFVSALGPFTEAHLASSFPEDWLAKLSLVLSERESKDLVSPIEWDLSDLLKVMEAYWWDIWPELAKLPANRRVKSVEIKSCVQVLRQLRHRARHVPRTFFSPSDETRFLDLAAHILASCGFKEAAERIQRLQSRGIPGTAALPAAGNKRRNTDAMRSNPIIYKFLSEEASRRTPMFLRKPEVMTTVPVKNVTLQLPVAVLAQGKPIEFGPLDRKFNSIPNVDSDPFIERVRSNMPEQAMLYNDPVFQIRELDIKPDRCVIYGSTTDYFSMIATHEALQEELLLAAWELQEQKALTLDSLRASSTLPKRSKFLKQSSSEMRKYSSLSISSLIVFNTASEGYKLISRRRSARTASDRDVFHVMPAGMLQDVWDIEHCVIKEYCEELFGEEFDRRREDPKYIYRESRIAREIKIAFETGACELLHAGLVLNLITLRPEICCVLLFRDASLFEEHRNLFAPNWEFIDRNAAVKVGQEPMVYYGLDRVEDEFVERVKGKTPIEVVGEWAPVGLASFWLGIDAARKRVGSS